MTMNELDFYFFLSLLVSQRCSLVQYSIEKCSTKVLRKGEEFQEFSEEVKHRHLIPRVSLPI